MWEEQNVLLSKHKVFLTLSKLTRFIFQKYILNWMHINELQFIEKRCSIGLLFLFIKKLV